MRARHVVASGLLVAALGSAAVPLPEVPEPKVAFAPFEYVCRRAGGPIRIVTDECGLQTWFALALPDHEGASLGEFCPCSCNADFELEPSSCPVWGGCGETIVETVVVEKTVEVAGEPQR